MEVLLIWIIGVLAAWALLWMFWRRQATRKERPFDASILSEAGQRLFAGVQARKDRTEAQRRRIENPRNWAIAFWVGLWLSWPQAALALALAVAGLVAANERRKVERVAPLAYFAILILALSRYEYGGRPWWLWSIAGITTLVIGYAIGRSQLAGQDEAVETVGEQGLLLQLVELEPREFSKFTKRLKAIRFRLDVSRGEDDFLDQDEKEDRAFLSSRSWEELERKLNDLEPLL
jgi:hypothetical protein